MNLLLSALLLSASGSNLPFPESRFDAIDGVSLHCRYWPACSTRLNGSVLLVHGFAASTFAWRYNIDTLVRSGYRVVAVDLPAYGYSDRRLGIDQSQSNRAKVLWGLLDRIQVEVEKEEEVEAEAEVENRGWTLVGHSMGGGTVAEMALAEPQRTRGVVLVDPAIYGVSRQLYQPLLRIRPIRGLFEAWVRTCYIRRRGIARLLSTAYGRPADSASIDGYFTPLRIPGTVDAIVDGMAYSGPARDIDVKKIAAPVLIIWGDNDAWVKPSDGERLRREIPGSRLELVLEGGHTPMETEPARFNALLVGFLASNQ